MLRPTLRFLLVLALTALTGLASVHAANNNIAVLRVESLDDLIDDAQRVATLLGYPVEKEHIVEMLSQTSNLSDLSWLDTTAPLAVVFPLEGMAMGEKGLTALFPASDLNAAFEAIGAEFPHVNIDGDVRSFSHEEDGESLFVAPRDGYLVAGASRDIVTRIDLEEALQMAGLPPGSIALDFYLEPVAPMAMMGLPAARQAVEQQMQQSAGDGPEDAQEWEPETALAFVDLYFDFIRDLLANTSRLQISIEVGSETLVFHKRAIPKDGSTFAGLVAAQEGGLPEAARYLDAGGHIAETAGQVTLTPAFAEALTAYIHSYTTVMQELAAATGDTSSASDWYQTSVQMFVDEAEAWTDCYRGDFAGTFDLRPEGGFQARQLVGVADAEKCRSLMTKMVRAASELPKDPDGNAVLTLTETSLKSGAMQGWRQEVSFAAPEGAQEDEVAAFWEAWFGDGGLISYSALAGDYLVSATGPTSEDDIATMIENVTAKKKKKAQMTGLSAETFAPVATGPGVFLAFDMKKMFDSMLPHLPIGDDESDRAILDLISNAPASAGQIVEAMRFEPDALHIEVVTRLELFEVIGQIAALSGGSHDEHHEHGDHHEGGHEGHDHDAGHDEHIGHDDDEGAGHQD